MNKNEWYSIYEVSLRIFNVSNKHKEIEKVLGLKATKEHKKGDPHEWKGKIIKGRFYDNDTWILASPIFKTDDFEKSLTWLFKKIYRHKEFILKLQSEGADVDIYCSYRTDSPAGGFNIQPKFYKTILELNLPIVFAVQFDEALDKILKLK